MLDKIINSAKVALDIADAMKNQDLRSAILDLKEELLKLREENTNIKEQLSVRENYNMQFLDNAYFNVKSDETKDGPFCSRCWDSDKKAIRLLKKQGANLYECPNCTSLQTTIRPKGLF